ncbi:flagellar M-ring protein FliF, partial [bacterium]|nr:flagellar M-ring protein FliF [bacterium]
FSLLFLIVWANRPDYGLLYSNLEAGDAAEIVEDLRGNGIPYKLKDGGKTILVPTKEIYELRIAYAGRNLISSGAVGYEIFDKNNLGLTEFMQKVNLKRALQGELAKTINQIEAVQQTRIHLVIPEPSLFEDQETKSSASVVVKLKGGRSLSRQQISGISQMVAGSVEGLAAGDVHIVDSFGNTLTRGSKAENEIGLSNTQLELKQKVEKYLSGKAQSMLDAVLGKDNAIVRVSAALNFDRVTRTTENYDPENTAVLSEERNDERSTRPDTALYQRQNSVTNYELNKTREQFQGSVGDIKRLSIAVFVNGVPNVDPETGTESYTPREQAEIDKITEIVRGAVGFSDTRQDEIVVHQQMFDRTDYSREQRLLASMEQKEFMTDLIKIGLIAGGGLILFLLLRTILKKFNVEEFANQHALPAGQPSTERIIGDTEQEEEFDLTELDLSKERDRIKAQERVAKEVTEFTTADPQRATRILKYWLMEADKE